MDETKNILSGKGEFFLSGQALQPNNNFQNKSTKVVVEPAFWKNMLVKLDHFPR